uniref:Nuclear receptor domain-containing protein n=1 Tax=Globodera pallida TaxID=36090 RepID=A0A183C093_GLOPA
MADLVTTNSGGPSTSAGGELQKAAPANVCVVCGDESDGLHFGRFTCRACAAFFRRTVSLKLQYKCKREGNCEVDKAARNMCRACRYQKCLQQGMLTTAVQHSRDGIGKRSRSGQRERVFVSSSHTPGDAKMPRGTSETVSSSSAAAHGIQKKQTQFIGIGYGRAQSPSSSSSILLDQASTAATILQLNAHKLFNTYYCLFSNAERAFRTYKMFGADDDRLLMPDGGYVRLSELQKFYENNTLVRGDPSQVAKIFENAMHYLVKTVVAHMRHIELSEMELIALFGIFIWSDSEEISNESLQTALQVRNDIIVDLHMHYRSQGLSEAEVTLKTANVFLLIPKLELSVKLMMENFCISELFNLMNLGGGACNSKGCILLK